MKNMALDLSDNIKGEFSEYIRSTFDINDPEYKRLFDEQLKETEKNLYKGPYISSELAFLQKSSILELINAGEMDEKMASLMIYDEKDKKLVNIDPNRPLYFHQYQAFERIKDNKNVVITTGTSSGKTESYLYPIINGILKDIRNGNTENGIRAILLFPMNALVNDQMERVRNYLANIPEIKFGIFNGDTMENDPKGKIKEKLEREIGRPLPINEVYTREQIRSVKPHILFTNYSMLEYLLIRPIERDLISSETMKNWKYMVLDEAHTYKGALGIEVSMLLRRLCGIAQNKPKFILTSATLGKGSESINEIISFASKLTSSDYEKEDIIFSERIKFKKDNRISITPSDYIELEKNYNDKNLDGIKNIANRYIESNFDTINEYLFNLFICDVHSIKLYDFSKKGISLLELKEKMKQYHYDFNYENLTSLINLLSSTETLGKYGLKFINAKYHLFVKAPDGCYVTIGNNKKLSLNYVNEIDGMKAFKIGICSSCKTPYIIGKTSKDNILKIDDEIDIDDTIDEELDGNASVEYYLFQDKYSAEYVDELIEKKRVEKFTICSRCGFIHRTPKKGEHIDIDECDCGKQYNVNLLKVIQEKSKKSKNDIEIAKNNLNRCPICDYQSRGSGVVLGFHIGKDRATSLLAQILYKYMPTKKTLIPKKTVFKTTYEEVEEKKQFLTFSDSRQQASFFNLFLNENNFRLTNKALILDIIKQNNYGIMSFNDLRKEIEERFKDNNLFDYDPAIASQNSWIAALWDLLLVDGRNSGEGVGLYGFTLNLPDDFYDDENIEETLKDYKISAEEYRTLVKVLLEIFRTVPAIDFIQFASNPDVVEEKLGYRGFSNYIRLKTNDKPKKTKEKNDDKIEEQDESEDNDENYIRSFLPKAKTNKNISYIAKCLNISHKDACDFVTTYIWAYCVQSKLFLDKSKDAKSEGCYKISASAYNLFNYKNQKFYRCNKCKQTTIYNFRDCCPNGDCNGKLEEINPDEVFENNFYRKEYLTRKIEHIACKEHTAQIKTAEAREIQNAFKSKSINILSCSTTFEMGINLGDLSTVFMRNVPPTSANYIQRAGRAGRSKDTQAFVMTFCSLSSHDYSYYKKPDTMIGGEVKTPYFEIDNDKIILRHITASALGYYFSKYPDRFESIDAFINNGVGEFIKELEKGSQELKEYIDNYVLLETQKEKYGNNKWLNYLDNTNSAFDNMINQIKNKIEILKMKKLKAKDQTEEKAIEIELDKFKEKNTIIQYFSRYGVIPGYGFPVDNINLEIYDYQRHKKVDIYDLSRDLSVAISEYAPNSEIIVDGHKYMSQYFELPAKGKLESNYVTECSSCNVTNVFSSTPPSGATCKVCGNVLNTGAKYVKRVVTPIGFISAKGGKRTRRLKPTRTYAGDIKYVGEGQSINETIDINDVVKIQQFKNDNLYVINQSDFYYCETCGYGEIYKEANGMPTRNVKHHSYRNLKDHCPNTELKKISIGHEYMTDVIKISFNNIGALSGPLSYDYSISLLYALLEGISLCYLIDRDDIGGTITKSADLKGYDFILFDTVPGGAGHVKRIFDANNFITVLKYAYSKVNQCSCSEDLSCYNCLRNYRNQKLHTTLKRGYAKEAIEEILQYLDKKNEKYDVVCVNYQINSLTDFRETFDMYCDAEKKILNELLNNFNIKSIGNIMNGCDVELISKNDKETYYCDYIWEKEKILLFSMNNIDSYNYLNEHSTFKCYMIDGNLINSDIFNKLKGEL